MVRHGIRHGAENRYGVVLLLILLTYSLSVANLGPTGTSIALILEFALLWVVFTVSESPRAQRIAAWGGAVGSAVVLVSWAATRQVVDTSMVEEALFVLSVLLYLIAPVVILRHLVQRHVVDYRSLLGAVCAYLLIGMMFGFLYRAIGELQTSPPFFGTAGQGQTSDTMFFSFTTLTTTGYGNLVPAANPGQSIALAEAITGQLFLILAFTKVVSSWRRPVRGPAAGTVGSVDAGESGRA